MKATLNKIGSLHGSVMKTGEKNKRLICFLSFTTHDPDGVAYITLPYVSIVHEKHMREFERAICKVAGKKELDDCVGAEFDVKCALVPSHIIGTAPTNEVLAIHKDGQELFINEWCVKTFGIMFKTGLETKIKRAEDEVKSITDFNTRRIRDWRDVLEKWYRL